MKRILLITLFILSQFLLPFVFAKCGGEDTPYDRSGLPEDDANADVSACDCEKGLLTADCVDECQNASDDSETQ